jgi:hypothetical protein
MVLMMHFGQEDKLGYLHYVVMPSPNSFSALYLSPRIMMAQAIRAILLATATAATLADRRSINRPSHGRFFVPCFLAQRETFLVDGTREIRPIGHESENLPQSVGPRKSTRPFSNCTRSVYTIERF